MAGIRIDFMADVGKFLGRTKDVERALEDVADALDDLQDDAKDAGNKLGDELKDGAKEAGNAAEKLEKKFKDTFDDVRKDSKKAGDDIGDGVKAGTKKGTAALGEFKDEAKGTAREGAASFSGEFDDVADVIQETLANALAGFGPIGAAAGMAAAVGIGFLVAELQKSAEKADEARDRMVELAGAIREAGGDMERIDWASQFEGFAEGIGDAKEWFEVWQAESKTNLEVIRGDADKLGVSFKDLFRGLAGDPESFARALDEVNAKLAESESTAQGLVENGLDPMMASQVAGAQSLRDYRTRLLESAAAAERAHGYAADLADVIGDVAESSEDAADSIKRQADAMWGLMDAALAASGSEIGFQKAIDDAAESIAKNKKTLDLSTEAGRSNKEALDSIVATTASVVKAMADNGAGSDELTKKVNEGRDAFIAQATKIVGTKEKAAELWDTYKLNPGMVSTLVELRGAEAAKAKAEELRARVNEIPKSHRTDFIAAVDSGALNRAEAILAYAARNRVVNLNVGVTGQAGLVKAKLAGGGPAEKGEPYLVGEEGEELFVPDQSGTVIPAGRTQEILYGRGGGAGLGGFDMAALVRALDSRPVQVVLDGKVVAEAVRRHNRSVS